MSVTFLGGSGQPDAPGYLSPSPRLKKRRTHELVFSGPGLKDQGPLRRTPSPLQVLGSSIFFADLMNRHFSLC